MSQTFRVLLDRCARREAVTHRTVLIRKTIQWGGTTIAIPVAERKRFAPRPDETFKLEQLPYLASVATLANTGRVSLFTSFELSVEKMRNAEPDQGYLGFDLLEGVPIHSVASPMPRSASVSPDRSSGISEGEQKEALRSIVIPRFAEILRLTGKAHAGDAFHFWTAEANDLDAFLTTDKTFLNVFENIKSKLKSRTSVVSPKGLCDLLGVGPTDIEDLAQQRPSFC